MQILFIQKVNKLFSYLCNSLLPLLFWIFLLFGFDLPYIAILTLISAFVHEAGHVLAILIKGGGAVAPTPVMSGFRIRSSFLSYKTRIYILICGPLANIIFAIPCLIFYKSANGYLLIMGIINLATALSNLLPAESYDGYEILKCIFEEKEWQLATRILDAVSTLISVLATFLSLFLIEKTGSGYWIFAIFFIALLTKIHKNNTKDNLREF